MSDMTDQKQGPALKQTVHEVQGHFRTDAELQDALSQLTLAGYDRADFSLPDDQPNSRAATPNESAGNPTDAIDKAQLRTMGTSMAGYAGAAAVAGATLATGGAAGLAVAAAAAVGIGSGLAANAAGQAADDAGVEARDQQGAAGQLILAVRTTSEVEAVEVTAIMRAAHATEVAAVSRGSDILTGGVSAASWTGA